MAMGRVQNVGYLF